MRKWSTSTDRDLSLAQLREVWENNCKLKLVPFPWKETLADNQCDGQIVKETIHDETFAFTVWLIVDTLNQLLGTHSLSIGRASLHSDFVIANMKYGDNMQTQRDVLTMRFKFS